MVPVCAERKITYLRLSVTRECDLACRYCVPFDVGEGFEIPPHQDRANPLLSVDEIAALVQAFAQNGITKVRLTGGEPLMRDDLMGIIESIAAIPGIETIGLTTNGIRLAELARDLKRAGLGRVNISIDSLDRDTFRRITGRDALGRVLDGLYAALDVGFEKVKVNTVVMRGVNDEEIPSLAEIARKLPVEVRFIELMSLGHTARQWEDLYVPASKVRQDLGDLQPLDSDDTASARLYSLPGNAGTIGIISPMSEDFCGGCNRVRVTCSGRLKPCLRLPVDQDISEFLDKPELAERLGAVIRELSHHKLKPAQRDFQMVQAETMCSVGG